MMTPSLALVFIVCVVLPKAALGIPPLLCLQGTSNEQPISLTILSAVFSAKLTADKQSINFTITPALSSTKLTSN